MADFTIRTIKIKHTKVRQFFVWTARSIFLNSHHFRKRNRYIFHENNFLLEKRSKNPGTLQIMPIFTLAPLFRNECLSIDYSLAFTIAASGYG